MKRLTFDCSVLAHAEIQSAAAEDLQRFKPERTEARRHSTDDQVGSVKLRKAEQGLETTGRRALLQAQQLRLRQPNTRLDSESAAWPGLSESRNG